MTKCTPLERKKTKTLFQQHTDMFPLAASAKRSAVGPGERLQSLEHFLLVCRFRRAPFDKLLMAHMCKRRPNTWCRHRDRA